MIRVGITGGIGAGKTLACEILSLLGAPIIDTDKVARELSAPGTPELGKICAAFGDDIVDTRGMLRRNKLRRVVFSDERKRKQLEEILHPPIRERIKNLIASLEARYCIICSPLLIESNMLDLIDMIVVIDCPEFMQIERIKKRRKLEEEEIPGIIAAQMPRAQRLALADIVIDNSGDDNALRQRLKLLHERLVRKTEYR